LIEETKIPKIKKDYKKGNTYKQIAEKHQISYNELTYLIKKEKWKRKSNKSETHKGNKNALGNKGGAAPEGNKNALKTGEYENIFSSVLDNDEKEILEGKAIGTKETLLYELKVLTIRERRMLARIQELKEKNRDLVIIRMQKSNDTSSTEAQNTLFLIGKIEDGLTRVQEAKRRMLDLLYKIECDAGAIVETPNEIELKKNTSILESINKQLLGGESDGG